MTSTSLWPGLALAALGLAGCSAAGPSLPSVMNVTPSSRPETTASSTSGGKLDGMISQYAAAYQVPASLVHRVVKRESNYNPKAYNSGNYGLMQIRYKTAKGMGYDGTAKGLFDAETNLKYAVKYLRGAYLVADGNQDKADWLYRTGYYYDAKRKGLLVATGLKPADDKAAASVQTAVADAVRDKAARLASAAPAAEPTSDRFGAPAASPQQKSVAAAVATDDTATGSIAPKQGRLPGVSMAYAGDTPGMPSRAPIPSFRPQ